MHTLTHTYANSLLQITCSLFIQMKFTTRSELISQGYEIEQKLMPLIEQVLEGPSSHRACGFTMCTL